MKRLAELVDPAIQLLADAGVAAFFYLTRCRTR